MRWLVAIAVLVADVAVHGSSTEPALESAVFGAGCFWSVELAFQRVPGVIRTSVGYAGGDVDHPTYEHVTTGHTGHAEAVQVVYDPRKVSFERLMQLFWHVHDPTTLNRQGGDVGTQYRSAVFYHTSQQLAAIERSKAALPANVAAGITTEIRKIGTGVKFWPAEGYHQQYLSENFGQDAEKGSLSPIQCYGDRGPIKKMDKPAIKQVLLGAAEL